MGKLLPTFTVYGVKVRAHNAMCASSFREDRRAGLIYGSVLVEGEGLVVGWEEGSVICDFCVYCGSN